MRHAFVKLTLSLLMAATASVASGEIPWQGNLRSAHAKAKSEGKLLLMHFYSDNCVWCDRLEEGAFQDPQLASAIEADFVPVKVHSGRNPKLTRMFNVTKFPTDVVVTTDGRPLEHRVSPQDPAQYVQMLAKAASSGVQTPGQPQTNRMVAQASTPSQPQASPSQPRVNPTAMDLAKTSATQPMTATPSPAIAQAPAVQPSASSQPAGQATNPNAGFAVPPTAGITQAPAPSTATLSMPTAQPTPSEGLELPSNVSGTPGQLAGTRTEGMTLDMPQANSADVPLADSANEAPEAVASNPTEAVAKPPVEDMETPELALQGFCPVSVVSETPAWIEGDPSLGVIHLGKLYLFADRTKMETFLADPTPYTPVLNGLDVVRFFEERKIVAGKREWGMQDPIHNRMFFFADEAAMKHFEEHFERYADAAVKTMEKAVRNANPNG
ncbi:MAG: DUF255 domain-containing protein [Planctomycetota bacterium]